MNYPNFLGSIEIELSSACHHAGFYVWEISSQQFGRLFNHHEQPSRAWTPKRSLRSANINGSLDHKMMNPFKFCDLSTDDS